MLICVGWKKKTEQAYLNDKKKKKNKTVDLHFCNCQATEFKKRMNAST